MSYIEKIMRVICFWFGLLMMAKYCVILRDFEIAELNKISTYLIVHLATTILLIIAPFAFPAINKD